jgi:predicted RNA binding protein YcfA (HicA-like mRNA interferase family)
VRLPRDLSGSDLAKLLGRHYGYEVTRQTGSHLRLTTTRNGEHHVTIPAGGPLRVGLLAAILAEVAAHFGITRDEVARQLFG